MPNVGIITEQGDLGLGYDPLNAKDQKTYNESVANQQTSTQSEKSKEKND